MKRKPQFLLHIKHISRNFAPMVSVYIAPLLSSRIRRSFSISDVRGYCCCPKKYKFSQLEIKWINVVCIKMKISNIAVSQYHAQCQWLALRDFFCEAHDLLLEMGEGSSSLKLLLKVP